MRRIITIEGDMQGERKRTEVDYSFMPFAEILQRIGGYEAKYSKSYREFIKTYDCGESSIEESDDEFEWSVLEDEKHSRILSGKVRIQINSDSPKTISELSKEEPESYYKKLLNLEKEGQVSYRE